MIRKNLLFAFVLAVATTFIAGIVRCGLPFGLETTLEGGQPGVIDGRFVMYIKFLTFRIAEVTPIGMGFISLISVFIANFTFYYFILNMLWRKEK